MRVPGKITEEREPGWRPGVGGAQPRLRPEAGKSYGAATAFN